MAFLPNGAYFSNWASKLDALALGLFFMSSAYVDMAAMC